MERASMIQWKEHVNKAGKSWSGQGYWIVRWDFSGEHRASGPMGIDLGMHKSEQDAKDACERNMEQFAPTAAT